MPRLSISGLLSLPCFGTAILLVLAGCDAQIGSFRTNEVMALSLASTRSTPMDTAKRDVSILLTDWFGTPIEPKWPAQFAEGESTSLVNLERLMQASGGVASGQEGKHTGLYREHCVVCHSLEGSGAGPASMYQDPYPRDFRAGVFKWKSTKRASPPTRDDLRAVLSHGIPGTAMPSFAGIAEDEVESLIDYVIYLSIRGELEQELLAASVDEFDYGDAAPTDTRFRFSVADTIENNEAIEFAAQALREICKAWITAEESIVVVPDSVTNASMSAAELQSSTLRGRDLFHGPIANCVGCHGPAGGGGATILDYDDWTKAYSSRLGITPSDAEAMRPMIKAGALPPRLANPRNLQLGVFRGGSETPSLYRRISQGIAGTPMPGVEIAAESSMKSLTPDQVLDLIHYVRSLDPKPGAAPPGLGG